MDKNNGCICGGVAGVIQKALTESVKQCLDAGMPEDKDFKFGKSVFFNEHSLERAIRAFKNTTGLDKKNVFKAGLYNLFVANNEDGYYKVYRVKVSSKKIEVHEKGNFNNNGRCLEKEDNHYVFTTEDFVLLDEMMIYPAMEKSLAFKIATYLYVINITKCKSFAKGQITFTSHPCYVDETDLIKDIIFKKEKKVSYEDYSAVTDKYFFDDATIKACQKINLNRLEMVKGKIPKKISVDMCGYLHMMIQAYNTNYYVFWIFNPDNKKMVAICNYILPEDADIEERATCNVLGLDFVNEYLLACGVNLPNGLDYLASCCQAALCLFVQKGLNKINWTKKKGIKTFSIEDVRNAQPYKKYEKFYKTNKKEELF